MSSEVIELYYLNSLGEPVTETGITYYNTLDGISGDDVIMVPINYPSQHAAVDMRPYPIADFIGYPTDGDAPLTVQFTSSSQYGDSYLWDFGDMITSDQEHPEHEYTAAGDYTVSLEVTNKAGSDTKTRTEYINVSSAISWDDDFSDPTLAKWTNNFGGIHVAADGRLTLQNSYYGGGDMRLNAPCGPNDFSVEIKVVGGDLNDGSFFWGIGDVGFEATEYYSAGGTPGQRFKLWDNRSGGSLVDEQLRSFADALLRIERIGSNVNFFIDDALIASSSTPNWSDVYAKFSASFYGSTGYPDNPGENLIIFDNFRFLYGGPE